jgi:hypothetical protein
MKNYLYQHEILGRNLKEVPVSELNECKRNKKNFVDNHLKQCLIAADCGWADVEYKVLRKEEYEAEFIVIWAGERDESGSRWINVSGNSNGAIMSALCENMW